MNLERTFGVELEVVHGDRRAMVQAMTVAGISICIEGYNHVTRGYWKIVPDGSILGDGYELVSPPLKGTEGLQEVRTVCEVLNDMGATVNRSCGLHVHHDAADFGSRHFDNLFNLYSRAEHIMDSMLPPSRRENANSYCRSLLNYPGATFSCRYLKVNFSAYHRHGTIEFRQHSGTVDAEKVTHWILLTQRMMERAKRKVNTGASLTKYDFYQAIGLIHTPGTVSESLKQYVDARIGHFAIRDAVAQIA